MVKETITRKNIDLNGNKQHAASIALPRYFGTGQVMNLSNENVAGHTLLYAPLQSLFPDMIGWIYSGTG